MSKKFCLGAIMVLGFIGGFKAAQKPKVYFDRCMLCMERFERGTTHYKVCPNSPFK